jgi:type VI secretion system secreted protein VgrG
MEIVTPLGEDVLLFRAMQVREELGRLSEMHIDLLSLRNDVNPDQILGKNVTVKMALPEGGQRFFNGYVTRFSQGGQYGRYSTYVAEVRPWLWFLTRTADCRIFQEMTVPDILKLVFADHGTNDFKLELSNSYRPWVYCVQYRETDFNFVSRLMEHEGIYYFVRHTNGHNTVVLTDCTTGHSPAPGYDKIQFIGPQALSRPDKEHISAWEFSREVQPGVFVHDDYDLERPSVELQAKKALPRSYSPSDYEVYDWPGAYVQKPDGEAYAAVRIDEYGTQYEGTRGATNARGLAVGHLFTLDACPRDDQNVEHLVVAANHTLEFDGYEGMPDPKGASYRCSFSAMSTKQQFRPRRSTPKPFVQGPQTAVVVGPPGDEIYTDLYGRVKVQFHWDRYGKKDQNSSCWIRVSSPWAGKSWGAVSTPRIGQEVIVDFLEGDPDQPIITGRVYNHENQPPFGFPAGAVLSGVKSDTHKGDGFNEMSFDDTAGKERVYIHGQYNMDTMVLHDQTSTVKNNRTDLVEVDDSETVNGNQKQHVVKDQTIAIDANRSAKVGKDDTLQIAKNWLVDAGDSVTIKTGQASITMKKDGTIQIKGSDITVQGSGKINVKATSDVVIKGSKIGMN